ncbi:MAG: anhydro-N-acetylmuramic acid kinase, partial [Bacteroidota bacterium]
MNQPLHYTIIGLMSGTSLDGLDIACCSFSLKNEDWSYSIDVAETLPYSIEWKERLATVEKGSALDLALMDKEYGHFLGKSVVDFINRYHLKPDFISSHGHTIFHQPENKLTLQIGSGATIAAEC